MHLRPVDNMKSSNTIKEEFFNTGGNMQHDADDPPPVEGWQDNYWWFMNRWAEWGMKCARLCGFL